MKSSIRRWMLSLTLPVIAAGSARAQDASKAAENQVPTIERRLQGNTNVSGYFLLDSEGVKDLNTVQGQNWSTPHQQFFGWLGSPGNEDVGAELTPVDASLRAQLNLPQGQGLVVTNVAPDGRAAKVGLKPNDILLTLDGTSLNQPIDFLNVLKEKTTGARGNEPIELTYLRGGKPASVKIKAEVRVALAPAAEQTPDYFIGTPSTPLDETFRAHLDIPAGTGLVVGEVAEGTPAAKAGVKYGDILLAFGGEPVPDADSLRAKIQAKGPHPAKLEVLRAGKRMMLSITPEPRKLESWVNTLQSSGALQGLDLYSQAKVNGLAPSLSTIDRLYTGAADPQGQGFILYNQLVPPPADLTKKLDELTAQVQALTKAVEGLKASQTEKK